MFNVIKCSTWLRLFIYNFLEIENVWQHMFTFSNEYKQLMILIFNLIDLIKCSIFVLFSIKYCNHDKNKNTIKFDVIVHSIIMCIIILFENDSCVKKQWIEMSFDLKYEFQLCEFLQNVILKSRNRSWIKNLNYILVEFIMINIIQINLFWKRIFESM